MTQPEALRLAVLGSFRGGLTLGEVQEAEDELNRLIAQRDALLEALRGLLALDKEHHQRGHDDEDICQEVQAAYAAIKNAEGEKT
jgi:hypothetical protein